MKLEKINDNKVKITLSIEELESREITLKDIQTNSNLANDLFRDLIEENELDKDFIAKGSQLYIEASADNKDYLCVTITKIDDLPDISENFSNNKSLSRKIRKKKTKNLVPNNSSEVNSDTLNIDETKIHKYTTYTVNSTIYQFENLDLILDFCDNAKSEELFFGKNSLYKFNNEYFLIFSKNTVKNPKFIKTYIYISEYCKTYYSYELFETGIVERGTPVIKNNALQKLSKL